MVPTSQLAVVDSQVERSRGARWFSYLTTTIIVFLAPTLIGLKLASDMNFLNFFLQPLLGGGAGAIVGWYLAVRVLEKSYIENDAARAFVTINRLRTLLSSGKTKSDAELQAMSDDEREEYIRRSKVFATFGPGSHLDHWWAARFAANNFNLNEASENFTIMAQCKDGVLEGEGSFRARPDINRLIAFRAGAAVVAADVSDLVEVKLAARLADVSVTDAPKLLKVINEELEDTFVQSNNVEPTNFERRFGLFMGDVTLKRLLPEADLRKTIGAIGEMEAISKAVIHYVLSLYGFETMAELRAAVAEGRLSEQHVQDRIARTEARMLVVSGQDKATVTRYEVDVTGVPEDLGPGLAALAQTLLQTNRPRRRPNQGGNRPAQGGNQ